MSDNLLTNIENRENNLNLIKLLAALLVIVSHAYGFATGYIRTDWLHMVTGGIGDLGSLAVYIFFFFSGLLVTVSILKNSEGKRYWKRRVVRIFPSFVLVTVSIVFLVAPFITTLSLGEYFSDSDTYAYLKNLFFLSHHDLPGVFVGNVYGRSVNGPIWTIRVEMFCYLLCFAFHRLHLLEKRRIPLSICVYMLIVGVLGYGAILGIEGIAAVIMPVTMFYIGMIYAVNADKIQQNGMLGVVAAVLLCVFCVLGQFYFASIVFLPYVLCQLAFATKKRFGVLGKLGACSYEIYLWGGFAGQLIVYVCGGSMSEYVNMALTIPITILLGVITNYVVENSIK